MKHRQKNAIAIRAAACGVALGCMLGTAAYAADQKAGQSPPAVQPDGDKNVVHLPDCKRPGEVKLDLSTGTTNGASNAPGMLDPKWQLANAPSGTGLSTPAPVYSRSPYAPYWAPPVAPATWVTPWQNGNFGPTAVGGLYHYAVVLHVPPGYTNIHISGQCRADDEGKVSLNSTQNMGMPYCHFAGPIASFNFTGQQGSNYLRVAVQNGPPSAHTTGDPTGLMVQATVTALCKPIHY